MAQCRKCGYPYATANGCPNCKEKYPLGISLGGILLLALLIGGLWFVMSQSNSNYNSQIEDNYEPKQIVTPTENNENTETEGGNDTDENLVESEYVEEEIQTEIPQKDYFAYKCRECGETIRWFGSYWWITDLTNYTINENTDLELAADDRIDTDMYTEEGHFSRGIFCSKQCAQTNFDKWDSSEYQ